MNWISEMGRDGEQLPQEGSLVGPVRQSKFTGAIAAMTSAALHASMYDIPPPFEQPVAKIRFGSIDFSLAILAIIARVNATSSVSPQQRPTFQASLMPCGQTTMKPSWSAIADQLVTPFQTAAETWSGWKSKTSGTG